MNNSVFSQRSERSDSHEVKFTHQLRSPWARLWRKLKWLAQRPSADGRFRRHITFALLREKFLGEHRAKRNTTK